MSGKWKRKALLTAGIIILVLGLLIQGTARKNGKEKSTGGRIMEGLAEAAMERALADSWTVPIDSRNPTPNPIIISMLTIAITAYKNVKASTVDWIEGEITCLFTRTGNTALGCRICLNSFLATLKRMTMRIHLIPPVVLPAQAPIIITIRRQPQRIEGQSI